LAGTDENTVDAVIIHKFDDPMIFFRPGIKKIYHSRMICYMRMWPVLFMIQTHHNGEQAVWIMQWV
jgi:hypothetical protein